MPKLTPQPARKLIKVFERLGFMVSKRRPGDHIVMRKPGCPRPVVIPDDNAVAVFVILNNLRTAGVERARYLGLLQQV